MQFFIPFEKRWLHLLEIEWHSVINLPNVHCCSSSMTKYFTVFKWKPCVTAASKKEVNETLKGKWLRRFLPGGGGPVRVTQVVWNRENSNRSSETISKWQRLFRILACKLSRILITLRTMDANAEIFLVHFSRNHSNSLWLYWAKSSQWLFFIWPQRLLELQVFRNTYEIRTIMTSAKRRAVDSCWNEHACQNILRICEQSFNTW